MIDKYKIKRILAVRSDRFGEFLLNIPALRALKETYPQVKLTLAVKLTVSELAGALDCIDEVLIWDQVKKDLKKHKFDLGIVLNPTKEAHLKFFLAGIPIRVGYDRKWGFLLTHKLRDTKDQGDRHEVDCNLELVSLIGANTQNKSLTIKVNENLFPEFIGKKIIAIHPFTSDSVKLWPLERFEELALRIRDELDLMVVMVGLSIGDFNLKGDCLNMVNKTTLLELAALLKRCCLLISGDSGPVHLAASVGTPTIALFRNDLAGKTAKRWGPWGDGHEVIQKSGLNDISVDEVFNIIKGKVKR
ncbi:MAG: glycosyltransferase family 9 protein [Candidatus Omnitrophota bacterium]|nr:glycosyltransferase family 9 protein [Candidatus Omnitrophota bacterium]